MRGRRAAAIVLAALGLAGLGLGTAGASTPSNANVGWGGFGNTPDENRYSPLTQINPSNVSSLGRLFTVDFEAIDPLVRHGEQSYPVEADGTLYMTTNDDTVWALNATTGQVKWTWSPSDAAVFSDYGVVANRGVALCGGHLFLLTLDMDVVSLDPDTGQLQKEVPISDAVPGANVDYGYSETSAPICYDDTVVFGAAGSEYGVRGFVMAYHTNLTPAWPNPFWTIPPEGTEWRQYDALAGGGVVWTPVTIDPTTDTLYFGTSTATPYFFPSIRPGSDPRADSLIAVNLKTGRMDWWQQQLNFNEWHYDTAQPPLVYTAKINGRSERVVSVATMEGLWFAYDAKTGRPIYQQVKLLDHTEHPNLVPGQPVTVYPGAIGGFNYSPASYDPNTGFVYEAAAETAAVEEQAVLTPAQKKDKFTLGDVFLGLGNGMFGSTPPGWSDYGSISAVSLATGSPVWKDTTPQPERGGVTTTASGLGFDGGGDGVLRVFDVATGKILWTFQTGHQIAAGASIYSVNGTEYVAITVGGTPTSSNGGAAAQLQVFALAGSSKQSPAPTGLTVQARPVGPRVSPPVLARRDVARRTRSHAAAAQGVATIVTPPASVVVPWQADSSNVHTLTGRLLWNGKPVVGADVTVDSYQVPQPTDRQGRFSYDIDNTVAGRHAIRVTGLAGATIGGRRLSAGQARAVSAATGGFTSAFALSGLHASVQRNGDVLVTGSATDSTHTAPPAVHLLSYELTGRITNTAGQPVAGAYVITRTQDRNFWTRSNASAANGYYTSFFTASDQTFDNPVIISVGVAQGSTSYGGITGTNVPFARLESSELNIQLTPSPSTVYKIGTPMPFNAAIYSGLAVGVTMGGRVVVPLSVSWPDAKGRFSILLPSYVRGAKLSVFESQSQVLSRFLARPGGPVDLKSWPRALAPTVPGGLATLSVPRS
jgi:alcohol dehydrogenase (cytochrome c)